MRNTRSNPDADAGKRLRAVMAYRHGQFAGAHAASNHKELLALGHVPGCDSPHILGYLDPIDDAEDRPANEDHRGMEIRQHPLSMLSQEPELWDIVDRFRSGVVKDLTHDDFDTLSAWQIEAWLIMRMTSNREQVREVKRSREGAD